MLESRLEGMGSSKDPTRALRYTRYTSRDEEASGASAIPDALRSGQEYVQCCFIAHFLLMSRRCLQHDAQTHQAHETVRLLIVPQR